MQFSVLELFIISATFLLLPFGLAYCVDQQWIPKKIVRHPAVYVLSLGVFACTWSFYGSVSLAFQYGIYGFATYYIGMAMAFIAYPIFLRPILRITQTYQLGSLADLLSFRYRSQSVGIIVTIGMLLCVIPLLALQIQAVADSIHILVWDSAQKNIALMFCLLMILFAILFGARQTSAHEKHEGLVFSIAFQSLIKLIILMIIAGFVMFSVFDGPVNLKEWVVENETNNAIATFSDDSPWKTMLLMFFAAAVVMPHMFHMNYTEIMDTNNMHVARWGFPLFLIIIACCIPFIVWAGIKLGYPTDNPEYFTLGIGIGTQNRFLTILAFLGGLSAATGIIIVTTIALAAMTLSHLVIPIYRPSPKGNIYRWLVWARRSLIAIIILASYAFYRFLSAEQHLSNLGIVAFAGTLQFLPGIIGMLYWQEANSKGFIIGVLAGLMLWVDSMLLPLITDIDILHVSRLALEFGLNEYYWQWDTLTAVAVNCVLFVLVSRFTKTRPEEIDAAYSCSVNNMIRPPRFELALNSSNEFTHALTKPLGADIASKEVKLALDILNQDASDSRPYALRRLRCRVEANLSRLLGPAIAKQIVDEHIPYLKGMYEPLTELETQDIQYIEKRLEASDSKFTGVAKELNQLRRYHRQTLMNLPIGVCSFSADKEIMLWNRSMERLTSIKSDGISGSKVDSLPEPWRTMLANFASSDAVRIPSYSLTLKGKKHWFNLQKAEHSEESVLRARAKIILVEDCSETKRLEEGLAHSERLASIGRLAAGVAHEIGNPVTGIACLAQNMKYETDNEEVLIMSKQIIDQTNRIKDIVQSLMSFAHAGGSLNDALPRKASVNIKECIDEAIVLMQLPKESQQIIFDNKCDNTLRVDGNAQRLLQIFVNLFSNAIDACDAGNKIIAQSSANEHTVTIRITDDGSGISPDKIDQIFDPFFTTKAPGKGTGLGLSLVYSIVEEHNGHIYIESPADITLQRGTRVNITLPRTAV